MFANYIFISILGCFNTQSIIRLLMYAIGFFPEHNRPDRDQFIKIFYDHIDSDNIRRQFEKRPYYMLQVLSNLLY
jgi:hypothetical protein